MKRQTAFFALVSMALNAISLCAYAVGFVFLVNSAVITCGLADEFWFGASFYGHHDAAAAIFVAIGCACVAWIVGRIELLLLSKMTHSKVGASHHR